MSNPEIGGTAHTEQQHSPTPEEIGAFAQAIREVLGRHVNENHDPTSGYQWTWTQRGVWTLAVGGILTTEPVVRGPGGRWRLASTAIGQADLVVLMLHLAGALPDGVEAPRPPARGGVYAAAAVTSPAAVKQAAQAVRVDEPGAALPTGGNDVAGYPVTLTPNGPPQGPLQHVVTPGGCSAVIRLDQETRLSEPVHGDRMGVLVVPPAPADRHPGGTIPAVLYVAEQGAPWVAAGLNEQQQDQTQPVAAAVPRLAMPPQAAVQVAPRLETTMVDIGAPYPEPARA